MLIGKFIYFQVFFYFFFTDYLFLKKLKIFLLVVTLLLTYLFVFRFELAVQIGDLRVAYDIAVEAEVFYFHNNKHNN